MRRPEAFTDRGHHKTAPVPSTGRPSIYEYREPKRNWRAYLIERYIPLPSEGRVLDAGCGPGAYIPATRARIGRASLFGLDINRGRLAAIQPTLAVRVAGDVAGLPFADETFAAVLAMHMLYHVPSIPDAVRELRRVLRAGTGVLYALTNSEHAYPELTRLYLRHGGEDALAMGDARFSNESGGAMLRAAFAEHEIELIELRESELVVTEPEAIVDEFQRLRYTLEPGLRKGASWDRLIAGVRQDARRTIARDRAFRITEHHGLFICRRTP